MKRDIHLKLDEGQILELQALSKKEGLPFVRFIETAVREYLEQVKLGKRYRISAVNDISGIRETISGMVKSKDEAIKLLDITRNPKHGFTLVYKHPQIERVTL